MIPVTVESDVAAVRRFNRFYTRRIGILEEHWLNTSLTLPEGRVLYEISHVDQPTAKHVAQELQLDPGYLSRILARLEKAGLITRRSDETDRRQALLELTPAGTDQLEQLDRIASARVREMLDELDPSTRNGMVQAFRAIESALQSGGTAPRDGYLLRQHQPGDMGWVLERNAMTYLHEYGWADQFEAVVSRIITDFVENYDAKRERCWIAERSGERAGCVFLVKHPDEPDTAKLRLLLVDSRARGVGLGARLVSECTRFARMAQYRRITLWTHSVLTSARRLYEAEGYKLTAEERHNRFGPEVVGQTWTLEL